VKRSIQAECVPIDGTEFYYMQDCTDDAIAAPTGWSNFLLFPATTTCDRTTFDYLYYAGKGMDLIQKIYLNVFLII
jgi:hypothetical protein